MIRRLLALIPRSLVHRVPRHLRDRWRTRLLVLERRLRGRPVPVAARPARAANRSERTGAALAEISAQLRGLDQRVAGLERRLDEVLAGLEQLESRLSTHSSGEAPTPLDDLQRIVAPVAALNERLERLELAGSAPRADAAVGAVGDDDA